MLATADVVAFAPTADVDAARAFYRDVLGLTLVEESPFALVFDANGTMLRVTPTNGDFTPFPFTILGWQVGDIVATIEGLADRGVEFARFEGLDQDQLGVWDSPGGTRVAWFRDPDGNVLSLTQFPT